MCGIVGQLDLLNCSKENGRSTISRLSRKMVRRGPDDDGIYSASGCTMAFRRLAILDPTPAANQPMSTPDGRYVMVFNGEVYNFRELRAELEQEGLRFRSSGDSEVVLAALARWGSDALQRFNGMFALALFDTQNRKLLIARDHAGIKPLYYLHTSEGFLFASQYDQILDHPWSSGLRVSNDSLGLFLRLGALPVPYAMLEKTSMMEPGTWMEVWTDGRFEQGTFFEFPVFQKPDLEGTDAIDALDAAVTAAVGRQMVSDVPIGTFLSGGIDSPLIASKMQAAGSSPVEAFTMGTDDDSLDESPDAVAYAKEIGVLHHVEHLPADHALTILDDAIASCGEPFADSSIFPSLLVTRMARKRVTVMLSGDGGDELFWGYAARFASVIERSLDFSPASTDSKLNKLLQIGAGRLIPDLPANIGDVYRLKHTHLPEPWLRRILPDLPEWPSDFKQFEYSGYETEETAQWLRWNEFRTHLHNILLKVDRASMYNSLEVRVPLLDREVIRVAQRIRWDACLDLGQRVGKRPLRSVLSRHLSHQTQAKRGFSIPMDRWLRGPLKELFHAAVLDRDELCGLTINKQAVSQLYGRHLQSEGDYSYGLWMLLSLALWHDRHFQGRGT